MADRTPFADLTRLAPQDPLSTDGYGLQLRNPTLLDYFLRLIWEGARDGHAALENPALDPVAAIVAGGQIPSDLAITVGYTLTDADGGETELSPLAVVNTAASLQPTDFSPNVALDHAAGTLMAGSYDYAITLTDGAGGETELGPIATVLIPAGNPVNEIVVSNLAALAADNSAAGWRLWRSVNDEDFHLIAQGDTTVDAITDDGSLAADCGVMPPTSSTQTNATSRLQVTVPSPQGTAVAFNIYATTTGSFTQPSRLGSYAMTELDNVQTFDTLTFTADEPPEHATTMPAIPGGGGGGGGLFAYPQAWESGFLDVSMFGVDRMYAAHTLTGVLGDNTPRTVLYDGATSFDWYDNGLSWNPGSDPTMALRNAFYFADAPGMHEGTATARFKFDALDADVYGHVSVLIGHQFGPRIYGRVWVSGADGSGSLVAGIEETIGEDRYDDANAAALPAGTIVVGTDYWVRVTRQGIQVGADLFTEDPTVNPAAVPVATVPLTDEVRPYFDWDMRVNMLPGFGWELTDNLGRSGLVHLTELKSNATSGGEGYKSLILPRHNVTDNDATFSDGPTAALNFVGFNITDERPDRDRITIATNALRGLAMQQFQFALALDPTYSGMHQANLVLYSPAAGQYNGVKANAAGATGQMQSSPGVAGDSPFDTDTQWNRIMLVGVAADDQYGVLVRVIDATNFLLARVDNATAAPKLQLVSVDAGVETVLRELDIAQLLASDVPNSWDVPDPLWLMAEFIPSNASFGAALWDMDPDLDFAVPAHAVSVKITGATRDKYQWIDVPGSGYGLQLTPAAGGANTLRVAEMLLKH